MPSSDPVQILLDTSDWATRNLLDACASLTHDQFHHRFDIGPGSLHDAITHILGSTRAWTDMLAAREQRDRLEAQGPRTCQQLATLGDEVLADFRRHALARPLAESVTGQRGDRLYTFTRGGIITHVLTHGFHHRAQCLNMLRHLSVERLPRSAVVEWMLKVDAQG